MKIFLFCFILLLTIVSCNTTIQRQNSINESNFTKTDDFDPICGDSVIWHIHLQGGFKRDTVQFVINKDTFPSNISNSKLIALSGNNECTNIYLSCYKKEGKTNIFLKYMPRFTLFKELHENSENQNLKLKIIVNKKI